MFVKVGQYELLLCTKCSLQMLQSHIGAQDEWQNEEDEDSDESYLDSPESFERDGEDFGQFWKSS